MEKSTFRKQQEKQDDVCDTHTHTFSLLPAAFTAFNLIESSNLQTEGHDPLGPHGSHMGPTWVPH